MRDVLRHVFEVPLGPDWLSGLSRGVREDLERVSSLARTQRPNETLRDDWDAVGIGEIAAAVRSTWSDLNGALAAVWPDPYVATVDLDRLHAYRGKNLHAVGPPGGQVSDAEMGGLILRLRIGFEAMRRQLVSDNGQWWPYIEAVHSNIPEFRLDATHHAAWAQLVEGDLVWFEIVGVHPQGSQDRLRYRIKGGRVAGGDIPDTGWVANRQFQFAVPRLRTVEFFLAVADLDDLDNFALSVCSAEVRPATVV